MAEDTAVDSRPRCVVSGKVRYAGQASAKKAVRAIQQQGKGGDRRLHAYRCPDCSSWHIGHAAN